MISTSTNQLFIQPAADTFRVPKRCRLPAIPFDKDVLRTGDCLVRVGCNLQEGDTTRAVTFHILPSKYAALKSLQAISPSTDPLLPSKPKRVDKLLVESADEFAEHAQRCRPDVLADREWIFPTAEPFALADWKTIELAGMPDVPQLAPDFPPENSHEYELFFVPDIRKKTAAKSTAVMERFKQNMETIWAERKAQYDLGEKLLRESGFYSQTNSLDGGSGRFDCDRHRCPRCGCSVFTKNLACHDCGQSGKKYLRESRSAAEGELFTQQTRLIEKEQSKGRRRNKMTRQEFAASVLISKQYLKMARSSQGLRSLGGSYLILVEGWLPRDVAEITGEEIRAIESRSERLWAELKEYKQINLGERLPSFTEMHKQQMVDILRAENPT